MKQDKTEQARRLFADANRADSTMAPALAGLGAIALKAGQEQAAYDYFLKARLNGVLAADDQHAFESLFKKRHGGSLDGFDQALDDLYRSMFTNPVHVELYAPTKRPNHAVLVEVFTGAGCLPCAGADLAVVVIDARYQSCNDTLCLPPRTVKVSLSVQVRER